MSIIFVFVFLLSALRLTNGNALDDVINELTKAVAKSQVLGPEISPWVHQKGMYPCHIRENFAGFPEAKMLRRGLEVFDNNAFVTLWVSIALLEASEIEGGPQLTDEQLELAIQALSSYHDKNLAVGNGLLVFWPQSYNSTSKEWYCDPVNVDNVGFGMIGVLGYFHKAMDALGLEKLWNSTFARVDQMLISAMSSIQVPPDFDDTFVNLGFGSLLSKYKSQSLFQKWKVNNSDVLGVFEAVKKYAYRPFSSNLTSLIDPRTYFYIRSFLYSIENTSYPAAFVTTWVYLISNDSYTTSMPFHINNIDLAVSANVLYGITAAILNDLVPSPREAFDEEVQVIYENTTALITYIVETNFTGRPDLALDYYPSKYNFYWFLARTLNLLEAYNSTKALPFPVLSKVKTSLAKTLRGTITDVLLKSYHEDSEGHIYYQEILGLNDTNASGKKEESGDDRLCSTAMAANTLLYTWMNGKNLISSVPQAVINVVTGAVHWMVKNAKGPAYNVLFSGSMKTADDLPFYYPFNFMRNLNGTVIPIDKAVINDEITIAIRSFVPEEDYNAMLSEKRFGHITPMDFHGYNSGGSSAFPFWSSEPFTHAAVVLALSQYRALVNSGQLPPFDEAETL